MTRSSQSWTSTQIWEILGKVFKRAVSSMLGPNPTTKNLKFTKRLPKSTITNRSKDAFIKKTTGKRWLGRYGYLDFYVDFGGMGGKGNFGSFGTYFIRKGDKEVI